MLLFQSLECPIDQTCTHVDDGNKCSYCGGILVPLVERIPSESLSTTKMEYKQNKFPSWEFSITKGRHWEKQMTNGTNCQYRT